MSPEKKKLAPAPRLPSSVVAYGRHHRSSSGILANGFCLALVSAVALGAWAWLSLVFLPDGCPYCWRFLQDWRGAPASPLGLPWKPPPTAGRSIAATTAAALHELGPSALPPCHSSQHSAVKVSGTPPGSGGIIICGDEISRNSAGGFTGAKISGTPGGASGRPSSFSGAEVTGTHRSGGSGTEVSGTPGQVSGNPGGFSVAKVSGTQRGSVSATEVSGTPGEVSGNPSGSSSAKVSRIHCGVRGAKVIGTHGGVSGTNVSGTHNGGVSGTKISRSPCEDTGNPGGLSSAKESRHPGGLIGANDSEITPSGVPSTTKVSRTGEVCGNPVSVSGDPGGFSSTTNKVGRNPSDFAGAKVSGNPSGLSGISVSRKPGSFSGTKISENPGTFSTAGDSKNPSKAIGTKVSGKPGSFSGTSDSSVRYRRNPGGFSSMEDSPWTLALHDLVFCVAGSAKLWPKRKEYVKLWWKAQGMRGYVWLDEHYQNNPGEALPQIMVSEDTSRFRYTNVFGLPSSIRIARIIHETFKLDLPDVHWFIMGDDDTIFSPENLMRALAKYDSSGMYYLGQSSESHLSNVAFSDAMAFGGAGIAISYPLAEELSEMIDQCLERYPFLFSSDDRLQACITELGVPLIKEPGFHQFDVRGSVFGLLAAHPIAPFLSMHHLDLVDPLFPHLSRLDSLRLFTRAMNTEPSGFLQRAICYDRNQKISYSISVGYVIQVYPYIISPRDLDKSEITFQAWNNKDGEAEFALDTRKAHREICNRPLLFFLEEMHASQTDTNVFSIYSRNVTFDNEKRRPFCSSHIYLMDQLQRIRVTSKPMPDRWFLVPRRQCCNVIAQKGGELEMAISPCPRGKA